LNRDGDTVITGSTVSKVVLLEIESTLSEPISKNVLRSSNMIVEIYHLLVPYIVHGIHNVERVDTSGIDVHSGGRSSVGVLGENEVQARGRFLSGGRLRSLECDNIVSASVTMNSNLSTTFILKP